MENKVLIKLILPEFNTSFDVFIPVNELVWKIKKLLVKSISDLTSIHLNLDDEYILINKDTCKTYTNNQIIIDTDIRNSSELIMFTKK